MLFKKHHQTHNQKQKQKIPEGFTAESIKLEKSICSGETLIGFYEPKTKKLLNAELVRGEDDIKAFYKKYGVRL